MMHRRVLISTASSIALAVLLAGSALAVGGAPRVATLSGANENPPADPDGSGSATIRLNVGQGIVCWDYTVANIALPTTGAHIHAAPVGVNGAVVVPLRETNAGPWPLSGCRENVDPALIQAIIDFPERYYVNVHNSEFPGGAIRGQLSNRGQVE
jgi:hypothetical protein